MQVQRHIFGSYRGYTTLAQSPGISTEDAHIIESAFYSFGQTYRSDFAARLRGEPAFFTLNFPRSRRGFVVVQPGQQDDNGRPTLTCYSAIVHRRDWDHVLLGDPAVLLKTAQLWTWNTEPELTPAALPDQPSRAIISRRQVARVLQLLGELESAYLGGRKLIVSEDDYPAEDIRAVEMLIPPSVRNRITTACRVLSPEMPCTLVCLAREAGRSDLNFQPDAGVLISSYAMALQASGIASGVVPTALVREYKAFGDQRPAVVATLPEPSRPWWQIWSRS